MSGRRNNDITYEVVRSQRATADIVIERDGRVLVRAPESIPDEQYRGYCRGEAILDLQESRRVARPQRHPRIARVSQWRRLSLPGALLSSAACRGSGGTIAAEEWALLPAA